LVGRGSDAGDVAVAAAQAAGAVAIIASPLPNGRGSEPSRPRTAPGIVCIRMSVDRLVSKQNRDGVWPYVSGVSWTEPTVYAVLALVAAGESGRAQNGLRWLQARQRPDGGWPPQSEVDQSTWVTALAALLPPEKLGARAHAAAIHWVAGMTGKESTPLYRFREWLLGNRPEPEAEFPGWPWIPGTAAWVGPTSVSILALLRQCRRGREEHLEERVQAGRQYLLRHMCQEGGWNHGSVRPLGYESRPYPETTGLALTALQGMALPQIQAALAAARRFWADCHSLDAYNWLRLGLAAHGKTPADPCPAANLAPRTVPEMALDLLASAATQGRHPFLV
jgi:hypothetical protein